MILVSSEDRTLPIYNSASRLTKQFLCYNNFSIRSKIISSGLTLSIPVLATTYFETLAIVRRDRAISCKYGSWIGSFKFTNIFKSLLNIVSIFDISDELRVLPLSRLSPDPSNSAEQNVKLCKIQMKFCRNCVGMGDIREYLLRRSIIILGRSIYCRIITLFSGSDPEIFPKRSMI